MTLFLTFACVVLVIYCVCTNVNARSDTIVFDVVEDSLVMGDISFKDLVANLTGAHERIDVLEATNAQLVSDNAQLVSDMAALENVVEAIDGGIANDYSAGYNGSSIFNPYVQSALLEIVAPTWSSSNRNNGTVICKFNVRRNYTAFPTYRACSQSFYALDPFEAYPLEYEVLSGNLPPGLSMSLVNANGTEMQISGDIDVPADGMLTATGEWIFTLSVRNVHRVNGFNVKTYKVLMLNETLIPSATHTPPQVGHNLTYGVAGGGWLAPTMGADTVGKTYAVASWVMPTGGGCCQDGSSCRCLLALGKYINQSPTYATPCIYMRADQSLWIYNSYTISGTSINCGGSAAWQIPGGIVNLDTWHYLAAEVEVIDDTSTVKVDVYLDGVWLGSNVHASNSGAGYPYDGQAGVGPANDFFSQSPASYVDLQVWQGMFPFNTTVGFSPPVFPTWDYPWWNGDSPNN